MEINELITEAKKRTQKQEPWQVPLAQFISSSKKKDVVYKGWAAPDLTAPNGVIASGGNYITQFYGRETLVARERIYQRDMGDRSFEVWALKLQGSKAKRFRIILISYMMKEGQDFDPKDIFPGPDGPAWLVRAGFAFEEMKKPLAGHLDLNSIKPWNPNGFFSFVKKHGGWNPPRQEKDLDDQKAGQNIVLMRRHRKAVAEALRDGKNVPEAVLKDYPRLTKYKPGTPGFYAAQFLLVPVEFAKPGDTVARVVYGKIGSRITPNSTGVLNIPNDPDIHGLHVTKDADFWKKRLNQDFDRPVKDAQVIHIKVAPGDIFLPDHNMIKSQWGNNPPSAAILVTSRKILKQGEDFYVEGKLAGKK